MSEESKRISEVFANLYTVASLSLGNDHASEMANFRREIHDVAKNEGKVEAKKLLRYYHRNKLSIPTYMKNQLELEIEQS